MIGIIFNLVSAVSAFFAALFAFWAWETANEHLIADTRAWVYPVNARVDPSDLGIQPGDTAPITISLRNSGREPAIDFVAQQKISSFSNPKRSSFYSTFKPAHLSNICDQTHAALDGLVIYPSNNETMDYTVTDASFKISPAIMKGDDAFYLEGCFAYRTFGEERKAAYCFMFSLIGGTAPQQWKASQCLLGNSVK